MGAVVIIPAHNEAKVIGRTLDALNSGGKLRPGTRVVLACNGCTDGTEDVARQHAGALDLVVLDLPVASKQAALNAAEEELGESDFPRVYLDADISASAASVNAVLDALDAGTALVARPPQRYVTEQADALVRAYYDARTRTPSVMNAMWGAGFFAVSAQGRSRWQQFPSNEPDDLYVDSLFTADEKVVVDADPVLVQVPRTAPALFKTLKRVHRPVGEDAQEVAEQAQQGSGSTLKDLLRSNTRSPRHALDAAAYVGFSLGARVALKADDLRGRNRAGAWERDDTTR